MYKLTPRRKKLLKDVLAIDFDGVIHDYKNPVDGKSMGPPFDESLKAMLTLRKKGYKIIVHTVKAKTPAGRKAVTDWLKYYKIPYHDVTAIKPNAVVYVDDRALRHTDWASTLEAISGYAARSKNSV